MEIKSINELKELYADSRGFDSYNDFLKNAGYPTDESWEAICKAYAEQFMDLAISETDYKHNENVSTISIRELVEIKNKIR